MGYAKAPEWHDDLLETAAEARILAASFVSDQAARDLKAFAAALERDVCLSRARSFKDRAAKDETVPSA